MMTKNKKAVFINAVILAIASILIAAVMFVVPSARPTAFAEDNAELRVHFVDVKQGDCILIELPDGKNMIIDAGSGTRESSGTTKSVVDYISNTLGAEFKYFDYAILTHPDSDHCNALDNVLNEYPSYVCYRPNVEAKGNGYTDPGKAELTSTAKTKDTAAYRNAVTAMYQEIEGASSTVYVTDPAADEQTITGGAGDDAYSLTFFSPLSDTYSDINNYSPIMLLEYRGFKFALSGDAEKENEAEFVEKVSNAATDGVDDKYDIFDAEFNVDVFKAGHHGSETSSSQAYLDIMTTEDGAGDAYYVFSCNKEGNKYYHPRQQVLDRITAMGASNDRIKRTDHHGTIVFEVSSEDGVSYSLSCSTQIDYTGDNTIGADSSSGDNEGDNPGGNEGENPGGNEGENPGGNEGDNPGGNEGENPGGNEGENPDDGNKEDPAPEESFFDQYKTYIIIAAIVVAVIILVWIILTVSAKKKRGDGRK